MWFAILGPLLVHDGETTVDVPKGRQRVLLAALLTQTGKVIPADVLAEAVWDGSLPATAAVTLRSHTMRLRRALGPRAGARLITQHPGYLLRAGNDEVDLLLFRSLCQKGGMAVRDGAWERAHKLLSEALVLWRGMPLGDVSSEILRRDECPQLEEERLQAEEWRIDAAMHLGRHDELVTGLRSLAAQHPLRERLHAQLLLALYRCGRQAEALAAYQHARRVLIDELGTEPGPELRQLHQQILSADPSLALPVPGLRAKEPGPATMPQELPALVRHFTGRSQELTMLTELLDKAGQQAPGTVVVSAIGGTAGVGKTALAVHWAHQAAERFPDGQLYVNLRGYDPNQPMSAPDALAGFLRSLGVPGQDIPPEQDDRAARYRSLVADKRMLIVLDNAGSAEQVRPLLPGTPSCIVMVTSRDALAGLVARDGATRIDLDLLSLEEAVALLRALIGARVDAEPAAATELAVQCCRLPLALRVAAELTASHPAVPLAGMAGELADLRTRLDLLEMGGDPHTEVRTVFSWSYRHLDADAAQTFRLLGLHPGPDFETYAAAALAGRTVPQARHILDVLARSYLIQPAAPGRYGMHDLLRAYACELTVAEDDHDDRHAAMTRLFDHYLHTAATAMDTLFPAEHHHRPHIPEPATPAPPLADAAAAREWLDGQLATLVATATHTAAHGWPRHATRLATTLLRYFHSSGHFPEALTVFRHALGAARRISDPIAEATALTQIGTVDGEQGRYQRAADHHQQALVLFRQAGDLAGEARALGNLGIDEMQLGRYAQAACHHQDALAIYRDLSDGFGEARAVGYLGIARRLQGSYQEAAGHLQQSLNLSRDIDDRYGEAWALAQLAVVDLRLDRCQEAAGYLQHALAMFHEMGHASNEAECLIRLGDAYLRLGRYEHAAGNFEQALAVFRETGDPVREAEALNGLGDVLFQTGETGKARARHATALRLAAEARVPGEQARAHHGLARAYLADGDSPQARHHWQEALARYAVIGAPEADEIRARLAMTGDDD